MTDVKVEAGNNRQLDLLALHLPTGNTYHVETTVKIAGFGPTISNLEMAFDRKFFGTPRVNAKPTGDHALGKNYRSAINRTYKSVGLIPSKVQRIYVCWAVNGCDFQELEDFCQTYSRRYYLGKNPIQVWSFRDVILPELTEAVGTSNYDNDALRTLSLLGAAERQRCGVNIEQEQSID